MEMITIAVDRMKTSATPVPVIVVGGGSILVTGEIEGASAIIKPEHFPVANAIGAAIAQVGGECDRIFSLAELSREEALWIKPRAKRASRAVNAGADADSIEIVDVEEVPLAYLPGNATRIMVKAVGDLVMFSPLARGEAWRGGINAHSLTKRSWKIWRWGRRCWERAAAATLTSAS